MTTKLTPGGSFTEADVDSIGEQFVVGTITTANPTNSASCQPIAKDRTMQYVLTSTSGNCSATILTQVSNDNVNWITVATTTFASAASPQVDGFTMNTPWGFLRFSVTAIAGTGAQVVGTLGI